MYRLDLLGAQDITGEEREDEQRDQDQQCPRRVYFLLPGFLVIIVVRVGGLSGCDLDRSARDPLAGDEAHTGCLLR